MILTWTSRGNTRPNGLFLGSTNPRQSMMITASSMEWGLSALVCLCYLFLGPITHSRQDLGSHPKKCTHGGHPLESPLMVNLPHVTSLHQSALLMESLNHVARSVWAHSSLISHAVQDGELFAVNCFVLRANCHVVWYAEVVVPPPDGPRMPTRHVPSLHTRRVTCLGQNTTMGSSRCPETRPWGASTPYGWWVL